MLIIPQTTHQFGAALQVPVARFDCLQKIHGLARSETADELKQRRRVRMLDAPIDIDANFVDPINELHMQRLEQNVLQTSPKSTSLPTSIYSKRTFGNMLLSG